jgi:xylulokinase
VDDKGFALGIDSSTQGTTAVAVDLASFEVMAEARVGYRDDPRLRGFGLQDGPPLLPGREEGEADQPATLFLAALDAVLSDLPRAVLGRVKAIDVSAQQHGQVWLGPGAAAALADLQRHGAGEVDSPSLAERLAPAFSSARCPIWMSASAVREAEELREAAGGAEGMTALSGSDSPLRFSGAALRHKALREPVVYAATARIHLISSFLTSVLAGRGDAPIDWGNGSGMSLMDWGNRIWSEALLEAASKGLPGGAEGLRRRLPGLAHPLSHAGQVAAYFRERYGLPEEAVIVAGSGDNPQTKVLSTGDLLSLGTSFVLMTEGWEPRLGANAMYDGLGRPFLFGCRTNGALAWERVRRDHGLAGDDYAASELALATTEPGSVLRVLQSEVESFPLSPRIDLGRREDFGGDYAGAVDSSLGLLWLGAKAFAYGNSSPGHPGDANASAMDTAKSLSQGSPGPSPAGEMSITGGAAMSDGVLRRVAAIWERPVARIGRAGAAAGAAVAAATALVPESDRAEYAAQAAAAVSERGQPIEPERRALKAYHGEGGYLFALEKSLLSVTKIMNLKRSERS